MADRTESTGRIATAELLALAADERTTARTLEYWRQEGLLPKAERTGRARQAACMDLPRQSGRGPLTVLLRLRERTKQPDVLRVARFRSRAFQSIRRGFKPLSQLTSGVCLS